MKAHLFAVALCAGLSFAAQAQIVYRCGPEGRMYSQEPCAQGTAIDVGDTRSPEQHASALTVAKQDQARGDRMARERIQQEKAIRPAAAGTMGRPVVSAPAPSVNKAKSKKKKDQTDSKPEVFRGAAPAKKARAS